MKTVAFIRGTDIFNDSRSTKEIRALIEDGYRVEILGWNRGGNALEQCQTTFSDVLDHVNFSFFHVRAENGIGIRNIHKLLGWIRWIRKKLKALHKQNGIFAVHACDLDAGIAAKAFCATNKVKLVYDIFDYYIDTHTVPSCLRSLVENMEIKTINAADVTVICTEERKEQLQKASPKKLIVIHNSPELNEAPTEEDVDYCYCGAMSDMRLISEILDEYGNHTDLAFLFAGYGPHAKKAVSMAETYENFSFMGSVPYATVLSSEARARVLSAIYEPTIRNHRLCAPNKFYEALALGKPIIVCRGTGIDAIVLEHQIGRVIEYDAKDFYKALRELSADDELRKEMGKRARCLYEERYHWKIMKDILLTAYREL
ncbi:MAG: glycosyltransferase family 4 protein [Clostridia bacterium]|nr:glycosyltransferase family 4 protein [Clostridia bacterium]